MTPSRRAVFTLDALLLLLYLLLVAPRLTGLPTHELLGITLLVPLLAHVLLSWTWIRRATKGVIGGASVRSRVNYALNWILFALVTVEVVSGLVISQVALPVLGIATIDDRSWRALHNGTLNWFHLAVGLHIAMNWKWIVTTMRRAWWKLRPATGEETPLLLRSARTAWRSVSIASAAAAVGGAAWWWLGPPSLARRWLRVRL